ncbi:adenylate/guanylate cyclase domain-containing protein [Agromyces sp. ZXT2-3]|uniref:adenylate/guanylate cyclase domain-containing protein n=1 Tax=Agromyces sp. ZXT2-3 TaxID=3461152 RepID=UPI004054FCBC
MSWFSRDEAAERAGVDGPYVDRLVELGIVAPDQPGRFSAGDVRRVLLARSLEDAAVPIERVAAAVERGALSVGFLDAEAYERFAPLAGETFQQVSERTGVPLELLTTIREAIGSPPPAPDDPMREDELAVVPFLELQFAEGFRPTAIERLLRVHGESTRRMAEAEGAWWNSEVVDPAIAAGKGPDEIANPEFADRSAPLAEQAVLGLYHAQQARAWTANIIEGFEVLMAKAGIHSHLDRPPAICFFDITGYTRLTQERGDEAAADLAATLARLVQRGSVRHGGKPIKWLGDGVMFHFREPGPAVRAGLEMVDELTSAGLPPAHVGLHSGPVLYQQGDYFGQTVNLASRIADYARPGEVLVTQVVAEAGDERGIVFRDVGPAELKGVSLPMHLFRAEFA